MNRRALLTGFLGLTAAGPAKAIVERHPKGWRSKLVPVPEVFHRDGQTYHDKYWDAQWQIGQLEAENKALRND
jgi:hypothetical protein